MWQVTLHQLTFLASFSSLAVKVNLSYLQPFVSSHFRSNKKGPSTLTHKIKKTGGYLQEIKQESRAGSLLTSFLMTVYILIRCGRVDYPGRKRTAMLLIEFTPGAYMVPSAITIITIRELL